MFSVRTQSREHTGSIIISKELALNSSLCVSFSQISKAMEECPESWLVERMSGLLTLVSLVFSSAVVVVLAYLLWALADRWVLHRGRRGPVQWPIIGATVEVLRNFHRLNDWPVFYFLRDGLTFGCKMADVDYIFTADPANVEYIVKTNFANYPKGKIFHENFEIFLGDGIFNVDGESWKRQRKVASLEFSSRKLRDFSTVVFRDYTVKAAFLISNASITQQPLDMQDLFMRFALDSTFKTVFGYEMSTLTPELPDLPFVQAFDFTNQVTSNRFCNPLWKLQRALNVGNEAAVAAKAKQMDEFIYNVIKARKTELTVSSKGLGKEDLRALGKSDLFTRFMLLNEEGVQQFTDKSFRDILLNFVLAGRDTIAVTLSWFVYMITLHPHVGDKIFQELLALDTESFIKAVKITDNNKPETEVQTRSAEDEDFNRRILRFSELLSFDSLLELHYLHACIMETVRLYPAIPMDGKSAAADDVLPDGTTVKKGNMVMFTAYGMGRLPSLWGPDATEFKPERWLVDGVVQTESPFKFSAFQAGPRICLGKDSAMLQLRMCLAVLCRFFKFRLEPGRGVVKYRQMSVLMLDDGLYVKVTKRCDQ